tara:strand:+ start:147 stop:3473 length:3327 start_codon:yes stop_codon:yes gene_type:complete
MANIYDQFDEETEEKTENIYDQFDEPEVKNTINVPSQPTVAEDKPDAISTQMYEGMSFEEANKYYNDLLQNPNVAAPVGIGGTAIYTDPNTGKKEYILQPRPAMFKAAKDALIEAVAAPFSEDASLQGAKEKFLNPDAKVSNLDKVGAGFAESMGAIVEAGAAGAEKLGVEGALEAVDPLVVNVDTGDSIGDAILTDAIPAVTLAFTGGGAAQQVLTNFPKAMRGLGVVLAAETGASSTVSTDEGTIFMGDDAAFPILKGVDLGSSEADAILEQRLNTLTEGMFLNSALVGVVGTTAATVKLASKFTILPLLAEGSTSAIERRVYEEITESLADIDSSTTPEQIAAIRNKIAETIEKNKEIIIPRIAELAEEPDTIKIDTLSALLRGAKDPTERARIGSTLTGFLQKGGSVAPKTIVASEAPQAALEKQIQDYLTKVAGETAGDQTAAITRAADELAEEGRTVVTAADTGAASAVNDFDAAAQKVVDDINSADIELSGQLSKLEDITGTDIVVGQTTSFNQVRDGLVDSVTTMTNRKNELYNAIPEGTRFDYEGFAESVSKAVEEINLLDTSGSRTSGIDLINTIRSVLKPKTVVEEGTRPPFGVPLSTTTTTDVGDLASELLEGGVDFRTLYNQVRPEISDLISQAYKRGDDMVAKRLVQVKKAIDEQVGWVAKNGDEAASDAAKAAFDYYSKQFAPVWRDGGSMQQFADIYDPVMIRGTGEAGFKEQSRDLVTGILSGTNPDAVMNMKTALSQVSDPKPIADYMIADVINGFASAVRKDGLNADSLAGMSDRLRQYAVSLNEAFPDRAAQINRLIASVENAAGNKAQVELALKEAEEIAAQTRKDVKKSELGKFLSSIYGREFDTTLNPEAAFGRIFKEVEGLGTVQDILARVNELPQARADVVRDGLETAYLRYLRGSIKSTKMQSGGAAAQKGAAVDKALEERADNVLAIGREVFSTKPEIMETIETLLESARMIEKQKQAQAVQGMSPTIFNREAVTATNRLIMTFIGPLTRTGAKIRSLAGAAFDKLDSAKKATRIMDNIFADPDYFLELTRKYNRTPLDPVLQENMVTALTSGVVKTFNAETDSVLQPNSDQQMEQLLGYQ